MSKHNFPTSALKVLASVWTLIDGVSYVVKTKIYVITELEVLEL